MQWVGIDLISSELVIQFRELIYIFFDSASLTDSEHFPQQILVLVAAKSRLQEIAKFSPL